MHKFFYPLLLLLLGWLGIGSYFLSCPTCNVAKAKPIVAAAPAPAPVAKEKMVWQVNDGSRFNAGSANHFTFPITSADPNVPAKTQTAFNNVSTYLKENTDRQLLLTGYYTEEENKSYAGNFANLGVARAEEIKSNMVSNGAPAASIITTGLADYSLKFTSENLLRDGVDFNFKGSSDLADIGARLKAEPYRIYFATGSNQVNMDQALKSYFADLKYYISQVPNAEIEVSGHTDNVGSLGGNTRLSKKRATEIKGYMERQGVSASNITSVVGEGPNKPLATNDTDEGKAKNRRVEIIVIK